MLVKSGDMPRSFSCHVVGQNMPCLKYQTNILQFSFVSSDWSFWNPEPRVGHLIEVP